MIFIHKLLLGKAEPLAAHIRKAKVKASVGILLKGDSGAGAELVENLAEKRIIDGGFALHHGVIVIENKTGKFEHGLPLLYLYHNGYIIAEGGWIGNRKIPIAKYEQMCYNNVC